MASNVTRDHHNLRRNLNLNGNYISNDGASDGLSIDDDGLVSITGGSGTDYALKITTSPHRKALSLINNNINTGELAPWVHFQANGTGDQDFTLVLNKFGNWGLGAETPQAHLDIVGVNNKSAQLRLSHDSSNYSEFATSSAGALTISTVDGSAAVAHINIEADGHVEFDNCAVGFDRLEAIFSTTAVIESGGSHDTDIDFRLSNKWRLEMSDDIAQMNLIFPNTSGNFLLVCHILAGGGGDHDVTAWKVWEYDSVAGSTNAAGTTDVMWAGGSVPSFTSGAATDIVSFYWDADEQQCYGVASLAFATP